MGLREEKKQKTRKAISDLATQLFIERGYHEVTTAEIAKRAGVSVPTLFNYFPTKESLVFDEDAEVEADILKSVTERAQGQGILDALLEAGLRKLAAVLPIHKKQYDKFMALIECTPELSLYSSQMWLRYEASLAIVIRRESVVKPSAVQAAAIARFVLDSYHRAAGSTQPKAALRAMFAILKKGWPE